MNKSLLQLLLMATGFCFSGPASAYDLTGRWIIHVENLDHQAITTLTLKFTNESARSCMSGKWQAVKVVSSDTLDKNFYPASGALSYRVEDDQLTIGRNEICDAYLWLNGPLKTDAVEGRYFSLGLGGSTPLGYFRMDRAK